MRKKIYIAFAALLGILMACNKNDDNMAIAITLEGGVYNSVAQCHDFTITMATSPTIEVSPFIMPAGARSQKVEFSTKLGNVVSVAESSGKSGFGMTKLTLTGIAPGIDTLTIRTTDGSNLSAWYRIIVQ